MHRMNIQVEKSSFLVCTYIFSSHDTSIQEVLGVMRFLGRKKYRVSQDTTTRILRCITSRNPSKNFCHSMRFFHTMRRQKNEFFKENEGNYGTPVTVIYHLTHIIIGVLIRSMRLHSV